MISPCALCFTCPADITQHDVSPRTPGLLGPEYNQVRRVFAGLAFAWQCVLLFKICPASTPVLNVVPPLTFTPSWLPPPVCWGAPNHWGTSLETLRFLFFLHSRYVIRRARNEIHRQFLRRVKPEFWIPTIAQPHVRAAAKIKARIGAHGP